MPRRKAAALLAALLVVLAFSAFRPPSTPGPLERDFEAYYAAGATVNAGGDPYSRDVWLTERRIPGVDATRDELLPFVGPAAGLPLWSILARLPYPLALALWSVLLVGALVVLIGAALRIARAPRDIRSYGGAVVFAVACAPLLGALALGQVALVSAAGVALATVAYRTRAGPAAFGATLVAALQPNLAIVLAAAIRTRPAAIIAASAAVLFAGVTLVAGGGVTGFGEYLGRLGAHAAAERFVAIQHTPAAIAYAAGLSPAAALTLSTLLAVAVTAGTVIVIVRERLDATTATLVACAATPLAVPFFHEHDFVLEVVPLLVLALRARGGTRALAALATALVLVDWFGLAQRQAAAGQVVCLGLAVVVAFAALGQTGRRIGRPDCAGLAAFALLAALAIPLGQGHVAPTWPDMLPAGYHASPGADASHVWADEQRAAGLTRREPIWGLLRSFPLAGCAILAGALVADARTRRRRTAYHQRSAVFDDGALAVTSTSAQQSRSPA